MKPRDGEHVCNAVIEAVDLRFDRDVFLCGHVLLDYGDGGHQGFGGLVLGADPASGARAARHDRQPNLAAEFIAGVMSVAGVHRWSDLTGKVVRVIRADDRFQAPIVGLGHPVKDLWFRPEEAPAFVKLREEEE